MLRNIGRKLASLEWKSKGIPNPSISFKVSLHCCRALPSRDHLGKPVYRLRLGTKLKTWYYSMRQSRKFSTHLFLVLKECHFRGECWRRKCGWNFNPKWRLPNLWNTTFCLRLRLRYHRFFKTNVTSNRL